MDASHLQLLADELRHSRYDGLTPDQAQQRLYSPAVVSTESSAVPAPFTIAEIMASVSPETIGRLIVWPHLCDLRDKIVAQDRAGVATWGQLLLLAGMVSADEFAAINTILDRTSQTTVTTYGPSRFVALTSGVAGFPNQIEPVDFAAAWALAGRA